MNYKVVFAESTMDVPLSEMKLEQTAVITDCPSPSYVGTIVRWGKFVSDTHAYLVNISGFGLDSWTQVNFNCDSSKKGFRVRIVTENDLIKVDKDGRMTVEWGKPIKYVKPLLRLASDEIGVISEESLCDPSLYGKIVSQYKKSPFLILVGPGEFIEFTNYIGIDVRLLRPGDRIEVVE